MLEAKNESIHKSEGQLLAQMAAARQTVGHKRKRSEGNKRRVR